MFKNNYFLNVAYRNGYFKDLLDVKNIFDRHDESLKHRHLYNIKGMRMLTKALLDGRDTLMEYGGMADFTTVHDKNDPRKVKNLFIDEKPIQFNDNHNG
jgi:hypothetical protein